MKKRLCIACIGKIQCKIDLHSTHNNHKRIYINIIHRYRAAHGRIHMHAYPPTPANELNTDSNLYMAIAVFSFLHLACSTFSRTHSSHRYIRSMQCTTCIACTSAWFITVLFHTASYAESIYHRSAEQRTFPTVHGSILVCDVFYSTDLPHKLLFIRSLCSSMKWILGMLENHCFCNVWNI